MTDEILAPPNASPQTTSIGITRFEGLTMITSLLRLQLTVLERGRILVALLAAFGLLAVVVSGVAFATPQTNTITEPGHFQAISVVVGTSAMVTNDSILWNSSRRLENRTFYPSNAPELTLRLVTSLPEDRSVRVIQTVELVYRAVRDDAVIWQDERRLVHLNRSISSGPLEATATIDTEVVERNRSRINAELSGIGSSRVLIRITTDYNTGRYSGTLTRSARLHVVENGYWIEGNLSAGRTHSTPVTRQVSKNDETLVMIVPGLVGFGSLGLAVLIGLFRIRGPESADVRRRLERYRYEEWISLGSLTQDLGDRQVRILTLGDLVNIGIDSGKRTILDPDRGLYGVIDGDVLYYYPADGQEIHARSYPDSWIFPLKDSDQSYRADDRETGVSHPDSRER